MGLETPELPAIVIPPRVLITPHGDWKRQRPGRDRQAIALITPHGDWKPHLAAQSAPAEYRLITPHGDWKHPPPAAGREPPGRPHYPSWGLETNPVGRSTRGRASHYPSWGLETFRGRPRAAVRQYHPHYPSWGLETGGRIGPWIGAISSLPLMGLETPASPAGACRGRRPHYPSWGLETHSPVSTVTASAAGTSLPLMGIGNYAGHPVVEPHVRRSHYPSWGLETIWLSSVSLNTMRSLPLMGIGNLGLFTNPRLDIPISLPLMGIGNARPAGDRAAAAAPHYPSWGLETARARTSTGSASSASSLPLMGIGNCGASISACRGHSRPHYPSWGLETHVGARRTIALPHSLPLMGIGNSAVALCALTGLHSSLPLMGIGNMDVRRARRVRRSLITPHGDWKRTDAPLDALGVRPLITPHGDWKLTTPPRRTPPRATGGSLPLMGIGNSLTASAVDGLSISLPLMGIGNHLGGRAAGGPSVLITPHGDWKRCGTRASGAGPYPLITPHGDWKPGRPNLRRPRWTLITPHGDWKHPLGRWTAARGAGTHYPSWGLETSRALRPARRAPPHYPSWGLETTCAWPTSTST